MKFLSDILAKAGLTVDGVVTLNNTATGQTPAANDNSTKLATTAWVRGFVTPYTLPIASGTTLGGIKIGSGLSIDGTGIVSVAASGVGAIRALQQITATAGQTVFTVSGGYTPGLIDVFLNGVLLTPTAIDASNGNTFTLADGAIVGDLLDVFVYNPIYNGFISSTDQVPEGSVNLYYTDARARAAISLTTNRSSGAATYIAGVLNIPNYQGLVPAGGAAGQILSKVDGTDYNTQWLNEAPAASYTQTIKHQVKAGSAINKGQAVYVSSSDGTNMIVDKASNASEATSSKTLGLLESTVSNNGFTNVITEGLLAGLNTNGASAGDPVWLGTNGNLIYGLINKPTAPAHLVFIGVVTRANANNGEIFVKVQNGFEFGELHDYVQNGVQDNYVISYESSSSLYKPKSIATLLGYTPANAARTLTINGISYDLSTDRSWTINSMVYPAAGIAVSTGTAWTTSIVNNSANWNTAYGWGNHASAGYATITYVGTAIANLVASAPATLDTLNELATALGNDPSFATTVSTSIGTKVPQTRTITINGTAYDLSADRSWIIASGVTSFNTRTGAITPATGDYTTAQVTESGNLYYTNTRARLAISLTTSGTSGAASYDNTTGVLNIPQYQGGVTSFNTRTGAITLSSTDVTNALGFIPASSVSSSARTIQTYTATANQTTFTVTGGYVAGLVDVYINGIKLAVADYTATNGTTVVLATGTGAGNIVEVVRYNTAFTATNALRQITEFTATAGQTTFTVSYSPGLVDVFYNGSKLASSEYTASNGTSIVLATAAVLNDAIEVVAYSYAVGAYTGQAQLNGTGFVKVTGTTVSYDNSTYLTTSSAASIYLPLNGGILTGDLILNSISTPYIGNNIYLRGRNIANSAYKAIIGIGGSGSIAPDKVLIDPDNNGSVFGGSITAVTALFQKDLSGSTTEILRLKNGYNDTSTGIRIAWGFASLNGAYLDVTTDSGGSKSMVLYLSSANATPSQVFQIVGSTGAATFSNIITATGSVRSINGGVDGTFQDAFVGVYSGNNNEQNSIQTTVSSIAQSSGFRFQISNGGGSTGRTTVLDLLRDRALLYTGITISGYVYASAPIYSSSITPLTFTYGGNTETYTQTTIYVNQNNTSGDNGNGIFIERGKLSNSGGAETRKFIIGARGGSIQWSLDGAGNSSQSGNMSASDIYSTGGLRYNGAGLNASDKKLYSPADGELQWMTHTAAGYHAFSISHQGTRIINLDISGNSYLNGGNTGFGLTNPSHRVHVSGNVYSTDTVYGRNLKPEAWAGPSAGSPTSAGVPMGYSTINISSLCDNQWRPLMNNLNDTKGYFWVTLGDAASKDTANYFMSFTSPAYGVSNFGAVSYQDNGWNTGGFEFTYDTAGPGGTYRLLVRCTSYYNSGNTAYGTIYFLRME